MSTINRDQIRERINKTRSIDQVEVLPIFGSSNRELTHKQKEFSRLVASGLPSAQAYREVYNTKAKKIYQGNQAHKLKNNPKITTEIKRIERMNEIKKYRSSEQIKALIVDSLIDIIEDKSNSNPNQIINASKVLGSVVGIDLFKETNKPLTIINSSDIKDELMSEIRSLINNDVSIKSDDDVIDLLEEINSSPSDTPPEEGGN
jgi:hypothetical protein